VYGDFVDDIKEELKKFQAYLRTRELIVYSDDIIDDYLNYKITQIG
jgi:hypothetical protein